MTLVTFVTSNFRNEIENKCLNNIFPKLKATDKQILLNYLVNLINVIAYRFNFNTKRYSLYESQFRQNNYRDVAALLFMILPFIDDDESGENKKMLTSLDELYVKKKTNVDINEESPVYIYSNFQYGRCIRTSDNKLSEKPFNKEYMDHNYYLLLETLQTVSNRLYVNWIDVIPVSLLEYTQTQLYQETESKFRKNLLNEWNVYENYDISKMNNSEMLTGLSMHDIYETISNELYNNILGIKWIIYDLLASVNGYAYQVPIIIALSYVIDLKNCLNNEEWEGLSIEDQNKFTLEWKNLIEHSFVGIGIPLDSFDLNNDALLKIVHSLIFMFDTGYDQRDKQDAIKNGEYISFKKTGQEIDFDLDDDIDLDAMNKHINDDIYNLFRKSLESIHPKHMYTYIQSCLQKFKLTWYSLYMIDDKTKYIRSFESHVSMPLVKDSTADIELTLKNLYNYSKSLVHKFPDKKDKRVEERKKYQLPSLWKSLDSQQRSLIINRLNDPNENNSVMKWFNISKYFKKTYSGYFTNDYEQDKQTLFKLHSDVHKMIKKTLMNFVFEAMIKRGVLSQFKPNRDLSDATIIINDRRSKVAEAMGKNINNRSNIFRNSFYYLTGTTYENMKLMNDPKTGELIDYFTYNNKDAWYDAYAMNWVSQISFFHKYLNTRVMYVTGGTGVGKSTQVPKLLLYALKAIDFNNQGKIVCTEPRTVPTVNNSEQISMEMGVPLVVKDNDKSVINKNYYLHYEYKGTKHKPEKNKSDNLVLKLVTDGLLLQNLQGNPILKKNSKIENKITYYSQNEYDIVIIDESHEHNANMDMILTLMKTAVQYNNSIKLVMISATMKGDEPYYRRYYRDINDNRMYPFNMKLREYNIDRINVDRRLDISVPGSLATRFKIDEHWVPERAADAEQLIYEIMVKNPTGNLLFFQPGTREISDSIEKLHKILPSNIIALPLYSTMNKYNIGLVSNLDKYLKEIKIDRNIPFEEFDETMLGLKGGTNTYNRCVIVATNIAEASVTFPVNFVVDTGTQKVMLFDYKKHGSVMKLEYISESSRVQRKGRVGRIGSGTVYYLYPRGTTENVIKQYDISSKEIQYELFDRLYDSDKDNAIFDNNNDLNNPNNANLVILDKDTLDVLYKKDNISGINTMIEKQYFIDNKFYNYFGNKEHYDYSKYEQLPAIYNTGLSYETLNDAKGRFYIIHPDEMNIVRNINGEITGIKDKENLTYLTPNNDKSGVIKNLGSIVSKKVLSFWNTLMDNLFISLLKNDNETNQNIKVSKTKLGENLYLIQQELSAISEDLIMPLTIALMYGIALGLSNDIKKVISMYLVTQGDILSIVNGNLVNGKYRKDVNEFKKYIGNQNSDIESMLFLANDVHKLLENKEMNVSISVDDSIYAEELKKIKLKSEVELKNDKNIVNEQVQKLIDDKKMVLNFELKADDEYTLYRKNDVVNKMIEFNATNSDSKQKMIYEWTKNRYIKESVVINYIRYYTKIENLLYLIENKLAESSKHNDYTISETVDLIKKVLIAPSDNILLPFIFGFKYNIAKNITSNAYLPIYSPHITSIVEIARAAIFSNTTIKESLAKNYILYLKEKPEEETIININPININLIKYIGYVYSLDFVKKIYDENVNNQKLTDKEKQDMNKIKKYNIMITKYKSTIDDILFDQISNHDFMIWRYVANIYTSESAKEYVSKRLFHDTNYMRERNFYDNQI